MDKELLQQLALAVAANEMTQQRFRMTVLSSLAKLETMVTMLHGARLADAFRAVDIPADETNKHAKHLEDFMSRESDKQWLRMVGCIQGKSEAPTTEPNSGREWPGWEI
jgi:hypothetical protein